jgi:vinculin
MTDEINEIIRVLQLTTYDEDEWDADNLTVMKKANNAIQSKIRTAKDWLEVNYVQLYVKKKKMYFMY